MNLSTQSKIAMAVLAIRRYELHEAMAIAQGKRKTARSMKQRAEKQKEVVK